MTISASLKPASTSPWPNSVTLAMLEGFDGLGSTPSVKHLLLTSGALGFTASSTSVTCGRISYSTLMSLSACLAVAASTAATAATAWPSYSTLVRAMQLSSMSNMPESPSVRSGRSAAVSTALTPASFSAFDVSIFLILACAWGLRRILPTSWPGILKSAPYLARPVTLSIPSGRSGRVPTDLNDWPV